MSIENSVIRSILEMVCQWDKSIVNNHKAFSSMDVKHGKMKRRDLLHRGMIPADMKHGLCIIVLLRVLNDYINKNGAHRQ